MPVSDQRLEKDQRLDLTGYVSPGYLKGITNTEVSTGPFWFTFMDQCYKVTFRGQRWLDPQKQRPTQWWVFLDNNSDYSESYRSECVGSVGLWVSFWKCFWSDCHLGRERIIGMMKISTEHEGVIKWFDVTPVEHFILDQLLRQCCPLSSSNRW